MCPRALINMRSGLNYEPMSHTTIFLLHVSFSFLHLLYVHNMNSPCSLCAVKLKTVMSVGALSMRDFYWRFVLIFDL